MEPLGECSDMECKKSEWRKGCEELRKIVDALCVQVKWGGQGSGMLGRNKIHVVVV